MLVLQKGLILPVPMYGGSYFFIQPEVHGFSTVLFYIFDNAPASYPDLISVLPDGQAVRLHFPAIVIQKQYICLLYTSDAADEWLTV